MTPNKVVRVVIYFVLLCLFTTGCSSTSRNASSKAEQFSSATQLAMTNSIEAFHTVERKHTDMIAARILLNYDVKSNFNPNLIEPFLKPDELAAREEIFKALTAYATSLSVIMG